MMKANHLFFAAALLLLAGACAKEPGNGVSCLPEGRYTLAASASDAMTKAFFKEDEAPSKHIYWEADDVFDFHNITLSESALSESGVTSTVPESLSGDAKTAIFRVDGEDFVVLTYPKDAVTLSKLDPTSVQATVTVAKEQPLSAELTPEVVPMASFPIALSETAKAAVAAGTVSGEALGDTPVKLYPLAGIVRMTVKGLPGVTAAQVNKIDVGVSVSGTAGKPQVGIMGENLFELKDTVNYLSTYAAADSYRRHEIILSSETPLDYTAENGVTACFAVNHSANPLTVLYITVTTTDGKSFYKKFSVSSSKLTVSKSKITVFGVDFTTGAVVSDEETRFNVEWAPGFLTVSDGKYVFGDKYDLGLYFRFGSAEGLKIYDNESYQTVYETGVNRLYSDFSMQSQPDFSPLQLYYPSEGAIVSKTLSTPQEVFALGWSESFSGANDPCSYVAVTDGGNKWRVPTLEEVKDLIDKGKIGIQYGNIDGSPMVSGTKKPAYVKLTDGEQEVVSRVTNYLQFTIGTYSGSLYHQLNMGNYWSNTYFWTNTLNEKYTSAGATGGTQSAYAFSKTGMSGAVNPFDNFPTTTTSNMDVNRTVSGATYTKGAFLNVRCVRDKGDLVTRSQAEGAQFSVSDYNTFE